MKVTHVKVAKKNIYQEGDRVPSNNRLGYRIDRSIPSTPNDKLLVKSGESYYWWKFRNRPKSISLTKPTADQLRKFSKPEFQEKFEEFESRVDDCYDSDEKEELKGEIEEYTSELQERLDNMPEQLQESSILNEYIEQLEELGNSIEVD